MWNETLLLTVNCRTIEFDSKKKSPWISIGKSIILNLEKNLTSFLKLIYFLKNICERFIMYSIFIMKLNNCFFQKLRLSVKISYLILWNLVCWTGTRTRPFRLFYFLSMIQRWSRAFSRRRYTWYHIIPNWTIIIIIYRSGEAVEDVGHRSRSRTVSIWSKRSIGW